MRGRFQKEGLSGFEEHQALELLLFYAIPRKDTNELAHLLLQKFGSIKRLFSADIADIMNIPGIGEQAATLLKLVPEISTKYWLNDTAEEISLTSIASAAHYVKTLLFGKPLEHFYILCLDSAYRIKSAELLSRGTPSETPVYIRHITEAVIRSGVDKVLVAHNHPGGNPEPSQKDIQVTLQIAAAMEALQIEFIDHIIVSDHDYYSFAAQQLIRSHFKPEEARAAKYSAGVLRGIDLDI